jgi:hypothetical protein
MPSLTYQYVYFAATGAHTRQPRATNTYGGFTPMPGYNFPSSATLMPGTGYAVPQIQYPEHITIAGITYTFAFMSVTGCIGGGQTSAIFNMPPPIANVGNDPVVVLGVYLPPFGSGPGDSGAVIDAFDVSKGSLVDNNFVTVSPDSGGALTNSGNKFGWVPSGNSAETITADHPTMPPYLNVPSTANFVNWQILAPLNDNTAFTNSGDNLTVNHNKTVYAFAFYKDPAPKIHKEAYVKETKEVYQEGIKLVFEKGGKELAEYTNPADYLSDPAAYAKQLQGLVDRLTSLETQVKGQAFIKTEDRPAVGATVAAKTATKQ